MADFAIHGRKIGPGYPTYLIAELSGNHGGDLERAKRLVQAAADAGADAVKLQTYTADTITIDCDTEPFRIQTGTLWDGRVLHELYREAYTPWDWHDPLASRAESLGMHCFSSPFDPTAVDFLETKNVPAYKIASFELVDLPLLRYVAEKGKPIILSTGMATAAEIEEAVHAIRETAPVPLALLKTNSGYPAKPEEMKLRLLPELAARFDVVAGLSDHTLGNTVAVASVALGASIIEKHLTLARADGGPDAAFSLEPAELAALVEAVRTTEAALREGDFGPTEREQGSLPFRRSLFAVEDIAAGDVFTEKNVRSIRPAHGLHPRHYDEVLGRRAKQAIERGTPLSWTLIE